MGNFHGIGCECSDWKRTHSTLTVCAVVFFLSRHALHSPEKRREQKSSSEVTRMIIVEKQRPPELHRAAWVARAYNRQWIPNNEMRILRRQRVQRLISTTVQQRRCG
jgi:hypothetical protein